jgi:thiol:disulfide interchange protein
MLALGTGLPIVAMVLWLRAKSAAETLRWSRALVVASTAVMPLFVLVIAVTHRLADFIALCVLAFVWIAELALLSRLQRLRTRELAEDGPEDNPSA